MLLALPALCVGAAEPTVILLSLDGTRHDYPERAPTPALDRMEREGFRARLRSVFPSNTFPAHVSLATGTHPDRHGIVGNSFFDPARGEYRYESDASWIEAEPIWVAAERQGVRAATFFWVGSETDWNGVGASYRKAPFDGSIDESAKVDQILAWLDLPEPERPRLVLSWWHGCDHVGHEEGPDDEDIAAELARQDRELARLLEGLDARHAWPHTSLIVTSDHGMTRVTTPIDAREILSEHGMRARVIPAGGAAFVFLHDPTERPEALRVLDERPDVQAFASDALPAPLRAYHPRRSGHLVLVAEPPSFFANVEVPSWRRWLASLLRWSAGMHGYPPDHPDMQAIFYALGRGVPSARTGDEVRAIDVAPSVAALLGIDPPEKSEGRALFTAAPGR